MSKAGNTKQANERRALKKYLSQYFKAKEKRTILLERLRRLRRDLQRDGGLYTPLSPLEIESKIHEQSEAMKKCMLEIMDVLELLPEDSTERTILELRHIDCKSWEEIYKAVYLTRTPCFRYYNRGLDALLRRNKVRQILELEEKTVG